MGRRLRLGLAFVVVAVLSALAGALFLAPALSGVQIVVQRVATPTSQPEPPAGAAVQPSSTPAAPSAPAATATASQPTAAAATVTQRVPAALPTSDPDLDPAIALVALLNAERQRAGCAVALALEPRLVQAAQSHAEDMARNDFIDHTGSDGAVYTERLDRVGYQYVRRGENIAAAFGTPAEVVAMWMDEPPDGPHLTNILNCAYQHAGVGRASRADGYQYWVLDLAEPKQ